MRIKQKDSPAHSVRPIMLKAQYRHDQSRLSTGYGIDEHSD